MHGVRDNFDTYFTLLTASANDNNSTLTGIVARIGTKQAKGDLRVMDHVFYNTKKMAGPRLMLFEAADTKRKGITNVNNAKPEAGQCMLVERIKILGHQYAADANVTDAYIASAKYVQLSEIPGFAGFQSAEITLKSNQKTLIFERLISDMAEEDGVGEGAEKGTLILETPKFLYPNELIDFTLELNGEVVPTRLLIRVELKGLCTQTVN